MYVFTGGSENGCYHIQAMRSDGDQLLVAQYANTDVDLLEQENSKKKEWEATPDEIRYVAAQLIEEHKGILDGFTVFERIYVVPGKTYCQVKRFLFAPSGDWATDEQLRELVLEHLADSVYA